MKSLATTEALHNQFNVQQLTDAILARCDVKPSSRNTYKASTKKFLEFAQHVGVSRDVLWSYKEHLRDNSTIMASTKNLYLNTAKNCMKQFFMMGLLDIDVSGTVKAFKISTEHKHSAIQEVDRKKVFNFLNKLGDARLLLIFHFLGFQGLRRGEVCSLSIDDYNKSAKTLLISGKGYEGKTMVHLHSRTVKAIDHYLETQNIRSGYFFPSDKSVTGHMSTVQLHRLVADVHKRCFIKQRLHNWRKYYASSLLENGFDVITASKFTRHKSIQTLSIYYDRVDMNKRLSDYEKVFSK